jgi:hypothetical protein
MKFKMVAIYHNAIPTALTLEDIVSGKKDINDSIKTFEFELEKDKAHIIEGSFADAVLQFYREDGSMIFLDCYIEKHQLTVRIPIDIKDFMVDVNKRIAECTEHLDLVIGVDKYGRVSLYDVVSEKTEGNAYIFDVFAEDGADIDHTFEDTVPGLYRCKVKYLQVEGVPYEDYELTWYNLESMFQISQGQPLTD